MKFYNIKFKQIRKEKKISMVKLSEGLEISRSTLWTWETGSFAPLEHNVRKMAKLLNTPVSDFSDLEEVVELSDIELTSTLDNWLSNSEYYDSSVLNDIQKLIGKFKKIQQTTVISRVLLTSIKALLYIKDANNKYSLINNSFKEMYTLSSSYNAAGKEDSDFYNAKDAELNSKQDYKVLTSGKAIINREGFIPGTKRKKWSMFSKFPIFDSDKKIIGLVGVINDITEKKQKENISLLLENALQTSHDVVWLYEYRPSNKLHYVSESVYELTGYKKEDFLKGKNFWIQKCLHKDDLDRMLKVYSNKSWIEGHIYEYRIVKSSDEIRWIECKFVDLEYMGKKCYFAIERDITDRKREEEIKELLKASIETMNEGLFIRDRDENKILYLNDAMKEITGYDYNDFSDYNSFLSYFIKNIVDPQYKEKIMEIAKTGIWPLVATWKYYKPNREIAYVETRITRRKFLNQNCSITIVRDITEQEVNKEKINVLLSALNKYSEFVWIVEFTEKNEPVTNTVYGKMKELTGYDKSDFMNNTVSIFSIISEKHKSLFENWHKNKVAPLQYEHIIVTKDGKEKWIETNVVKIDVNNKMLYCFKHIDIDERKRLQSELSGFLKKK